MKKTILLFSFFLFFINSAFSQTVYVTKTGEKYHREGCQHLRQSSKSLDTKDAINAGYEPCKTCRPGTYNSTSQNLVTQANYNSDKSSSNSKSVQCSGRTKKGTRCKRMTTNSSGRCYQH